MAIARQILDQSSLPKMIHQFLTYTNILAQAPGFNIDNLFVYAIIFGIGFTIILSLICCIYGRRHAKLKKQALEQQVIPVVKPQPPHQDESLSHGYPFFCFLAIVTIAGFMILFDIPLPTFPLVPEEVGQLIGFVVMAVLFAVIIPIILVCGIIGLRRGSRRYSEAVDKTSTPLLREKPMKDKPTSCPVCGESITETDKFCGRCGAHLGDYQEGR